MMRAALVLLMAAPILVAAAGFGPAPASSAGPAACAEPDPPVYYAIDLVTTKRTPGSRTAEGRADVLFAPSPFGVAVAGDGSYAYDLKIRVNRLAPAKNGAYVVWITRSDLSEVRRLGVLDDAFTLEGRVTWNKFLVVISLEPDAATQAARWSGPIVLRGLSKSGLMHTMAGHGPFQSEPCATYGFR